MKQTAVEWFAKELNKWRIKEFGLNAVIGIPTEVFEQAKEMEKEQIKDAYDRGYDEYDIYRNGQNYYNETFKSE